MERSGIVIGEDVTSGLDVHRLLCMVPQTHSLLFRTVPVLLPENLTICYNAPGSLAPSKPPHVRTLPGLDEKEYAGLRRGRAQLIMRNFEEEKTVVQTRPMYACMSFGTTSGERQGVHNGEEERRR